MVTIGDRRELTLSDIEDWAAREVMGWTDICPMPATAGQKCGSWHRKDDLEFETGEWHPAYEASDFQMLMERLVLVHGFKVGIRWEREGASDSPRVGIAALLLSREGPSVIAFGETPGGAVLRGLYALHLKVGGVPRG